jgi:hypothetical protein
LSRWRSNWNFAFSSTAAWWPRSARLMIVMDGRTTDRSLGVGLVADQGVVEQDGLAAFVARENETSGRTSFMPSSRFLGVAAGRWSIPPWSWCRACVRRDLGDNRRADGAGDVAGVGLLGGAAASRSSLRWWP